MKPATCFDNTSQNETPVTLLPLTWRAPAITLPVTVACALLLTAGCAQTRGMGQPNTFAPGGYAPGATGGGMQPTPLPDSQPSLGSPAQAMPESQTLPEPTLPGGMTPDLGFPGSSGGLPGNSGAYETQRPPSGGGPILELPEASLDSKLHRSSYLQAPDPKSRTSFFRPSIPTLPISLAQRPAAPYDEPVWNRFNHSTDRRPIDSLVMGKDGRRIAVTASVHGDETQSIALVEELSRYLTRHRTDLKAVRILVIRCPNPDGLFSRSAYNIHGIDLNRNFPSRNWKAASKRAGSKPGSEIETQTVVRLLQEFHPELLIHVKDTRGRGYVNYEGTASDIAQTFAKAENCEVVHDLGKATTGSIENYAATVLQCPSVTLLLPRQRSAKAAWSEYGNSLVSLVTTAPGHGVGNPATGRPEEPNNGFDPFAQAPVASAAPRKPAEGTPFNTSLSNPVPSTPEAGIPSTPQGEPARRAMPEFPAEVPAHGYLDLPPPPQT